MKLTALCRLTLIRVENGCIDSLKGDSTDWPRRECARRFSEPYPPDSPPLKGSRPLNCDRHGRLVRPTTLDK